MTDGPLELHLIDAFSSGPFTGNPAAVVLLDHARPDSWLQQVAMEMNQAETAFLLRQDDGWSLRWLTPVAEVALCGHATVASTHFLWERGDLAVDQVARFHTLSGVLTAVRNAQGEITLDFPGIPSNPLAPPDDIAAVLGVTPRQTLRGRYDLLCVVDDAAAVRRLTPDLGAMAKWDARGVSVTAAGDQPGIDFVSRCFFPRLGVPEDPVTGSAHCALAVYWSRHLGRAKVTGYQASPRGGTVRCAVVGDRVHLSGRAVTTVRGQLLAS
jgi:PhzF family phenazine biosynthesis protein